MKSRLVLLLVLISALLDSFSFGEIRGPVSQIAQDKSGRVWVIRGTYPHSRISPNPKCNLAFLDGENMIDEEVPQASGLIPAKFVVCDDQRVGCIWLDGDLKECLVTVHEQETSATLARFPINARLLRSQGLVGGSVLLFFWDGSLVEITKEGVVTSSILPTRTSGISESEGVSRTNNRLRCERSFDGGCYLWLPPDSQGDSRVKISGLLKYKAGTFEKIDLTKCNDPEMIINVIEVAPSVLWIADRNLGVMRLDLGSNTMMPVIDSAGLSSSSGLQEQVVELVSFEGKQYAISSAVTQAAYSAPYSIFDAAFSLWVYENDHWMQLSEQIGSWASHFGLSRPFLRHPEGLLVLSDRWGPTLIPSDRSPPVVHLDWQTRFPFPNAHEMLNGPDAKVIVMSMEGGLKSITLQTKKEMPSKFTVFEASAILRDNDGFIWSRNYKDGIKRWDGESWLSIHQPVHIKADYKKHTWYKDDLDRAWFIRANQTCAVLSLRALTWEEYPDLQTALQKELPHPGKLFSGSRNARWIAFNHNKIALLGDGNEVSSFNGLEWKTLQNRLAVRPWASDAEVSWVKDTLTIKSYNETWSAPVDDQDWSLEKISPEQLSETRRLNSLSRNSRPSDEGGAIWTTDYKDLNRTVAGKSIKLLTMADPHPFRDLNEVVSVTLDRKGAAIIGYGKQLVSHQPTGWIRMPATTLAPQTLAKVEVLPGGNARVHVSATAGEGGEILSEDHRFFTYRIDRGEWVRHEGPEIIRLVELSPGAHSFEIRAFNKELLGDATPTVLYFSNEIADPETMQQWVKQFSSDKLALRKEAADSLRAQSSASIKILKANYDGADDVTRWWINETIRQIEADLTAAETPAPDK